MATLVVQPRKKLSSAQQVGVVLLLLAVLFFSERFGIEQFAVNILSKPVLVLQRVELRIVQVFGGVPQLVGSNLEKTRYIRDLENRYAKVVSQLVELESLREENLQLRAVIENRDITLVERTVTSPIVSLAKPGIAGGQRDGIQIGDTVFIAGTLVGIVSDVGEHQSTITLLSQKQSKPLLVRTQSGAEGIARGDGQRILLTEIPKDQVIEVGDRISTLGQDGIESDVFVGVVSEVKSEPESATQTAVIQQLVSFYSTKIVEVQ